MKKLKLVIWAVLAMSTLLTGCKEDVNESIGELNPEISLYTLRSLHKNMDLQLNESNALGAKYVKALVVSRAENKNLPENTIAVQNIWRNQRRGILVEVTDASSFKFGDSVQININGTKLTKKSGLMFLSAVNNQQVTVFASNKNVAPLPVSVANLKAKFEEFESTYINVTAEVDPEPAAGTALKGERTLIDGDKNEITLHTENDATFAGQPIAPSASFRGIAFREGDKLQIRMQDYSDMAFASGKLYAGWPETFDAVDASVKGSYDMGEKNDVSFPTGQWKLYQAILGTTAGRDRIVSGKNAIRMQQNLSVDGYVQMNFDVPNGASKVTLWYGSYWTDRSCTFKLEYSTDQGATWIQTGESIADAHTTTESMNSKQAVFLMNVQGAVRFRVTKLGLGTSNNVINNGRLGLDDIAIYKSY
ncbi:DUF5689 domain-containing protein [Sphingobacterium athyrii]|uniref:DUF5689 domain-containing protein n=1 Tax=Sphingobacterium athyrii TaxID=2152717 RepID=A0A363NR77_9SPHI|nr:DUF5689 domain-containing protein [Sphingobacterium athyrii]PUV23315.1 hypothetical protein DCO56_15400 [Sphingobacterium athyrii]